MMKKIITFILLTILLSFTQSCREQEVISKQIQLEESIEESFAKNSDLTKYSDRNEFIKYDNYSRYFIYDKMNDEQKKRLWINKIEFVSKNVDLNKKQKFAVEQVLKELKLNGLKDFQKLTSFVVNGSFSDYEEKLYFQNLSSFDKTTHEMTPYFISFKLAPVDGSSGGGSTETCYTRWCVACLGGTPCVTGCPTTTTGCGLFNNEPCDATCQ